MYNNHFGFRESPFSVTPDPQFFYTNAVYLEAFAALRYGIDGKKGFIVITGEVGTGKTTLLRKLLRTLEDTVHSVYIFNTYISFPELLQLTLHDLGITPKDKTKVTMIQELNDYLIKQLKQGHNVLLLIDEAQNLSDEVLESLRLLSNLETDEEKLIQIVLMGQPELLTKLAQPNLRQLKQRVALQCRISPLQDKEVGPYIESRLQAIGYTGKDIFQPGAVERIAFYSNGIPRVVNIICDNALLYAYAGARHAVSPDMIDEAARDLALQAEAPASKTDAVGEKSASPAGREKQVKRAPRKGLHYAPLRLSKSVVGSGLAMLVLIVVVSIIDSAGLFRGAGKRFELSKPNLASVSQLEAVAEKPKTEDAKPQSRQIVIERGFTISKIAADTYGSNSVLGMDLIKEFNPQIQNLNWILPGQTLLLPVLNQKTLLRQQPDHSYRLIVGSFFGRAEADTYSRALRDKGYQVAITPSRVSDDLTLVRVEIDGLKNLNEVTQTWEVVLRNKWLVPASERTGRIQLSQAGVAY